MLNAKHLTYRVKNLVNLSENHLNHMKPATIDRHTQINAYPNKSLKVRKNNENY